MNDIHTHIEKDAFLYIFGYWNNEILIKLCHLLANRANIVTTQYYNFCGGLQVPYYFI